MIKKIFFLAVGAQLSTACMCPKILKRVCDVETAKVYDNSCLAECAGVKYIAECDKPVVVGLVSELPVPVVVGEPQPKPIVAGLFEPYEPPIIVGEPEPKPIVAGLFKPYEPELPIVVGMPPYEPELPIVVGMPPYEPELPIVVGMPPIAVGKVVEPTKPPIAIGKIAEPQFPEVVVGMMPPEPGCLCPMIYAPVCDKETYRTFSNECMAGCEGAVELSTGPCGEKPPVHVGLPPIEPGCICAEIYDPVCDEETGRTFSNKCFAGCEGAVQLSKGPCGEKPPVEPGCICAAIYDPVCDEETGRTFSNKCFAGCEGAVQLSKGPCGEKPPVEGCGCPKNYDPVCDEETGRTFGNKCLAGCEGAVQLSQGPCEEGRPMGSTISPQNAQHLCLDASKGKKATLANCDSSDGQLFSFEDGRLQITVSNKCLDHRLRIRSCNQVKAGIVKFNQNRGQFKMKRKCLHYKYSQERLSMKKCKPNLQSQVFVF